MKEKIYSWLLAHQDEMVRDICDLVRIPSVLSEATDEYPFGEQCFRAVEKSMEIAKRLGLETSLFKNMVGQASLKKGHADFGIWAHSDVMPVSGQWTVPPFDPVVRDGRIYGRGSTDNKGQLVMAMYALRCLRELGVELEHNTAVFVGCNEENGKHDIKAWLAENEEPFFNLAPDSSFTIGYAEKAVLHFWLEAPMEQKGLLDIHGGTIVKTTAVEASAVLELNEINRDALSDLKNAEYTIDGNTVVINAKGKGGSVAFAPGSDNPIAKLITAMDEAGIFAGGIAPQLKYIADVCLDDSGAFFGIDCEDDVIGKLHFAGTLLSFRNGVISLGCDVRHPMSAPGEQLLETVGKAIEGSGFEITAFNISPTIYSDPDEPGALACAEIYNQLALEFGRTQKNKYIISGGTYARHFRRGYAFGLDAGANAHSGDEYVNIDRLIFGSLVYALAMIKLDDIYRDQNEGKDA